MKVRDRWDRIAAAGGAAVFVVHDDPDTVRDVFLGPDLDAAALPFPLLVDHGREAYRRWGCGRISWAGLWLDPAVWKQYWQLLRAGASIRGAGSDTRQLGGDFVVGPDGTVVYSRPQQRDDRPPVGELADVMETAADPGEGDD